MYKAFATILALGATILLTGATVASAQTDLRNALGQAGDTLTIDSSGSVGRADVARALTILGNTPEYAPMVAPQDQVIVVVQEGGVVTLDGVHLQHQGQTEFAIYVNGGALQLRNCRISGAFVSAIQVAAGRAEIENCVIEGAGDAVAASSGTEVSLSEVTIRKGTGAGLFLNGAVGAIKNVVFQDAGPNPIFVQKGGTLDAMDVAISGQFDAGLGAIGANTIRVAQLDIQGSGSTGVLLQDTNGTELSEYTAGGGLSSGLEAGNAGSLSLEAFKIAADAGILVSGAGEMTIRLGALDVREVGMDISGAKSAEVDKIRVNGGEVGLVARGRIDELRVGKSRFTKQSIAGIVLQDTSAPADAWPHEINQSFFVQDRDAVAVAARDSFAFELRNSGLMVSGDRAVDVHNSPGSQISDNLIVSAPFERTGFATVYGATFDERRIVRDGVADPLVGDGITSDANAFLTHADLLRSPTIPPAARMALADYARTGVAGDPIDLVIALYDAAPLLLPNDQTSEVALLPPHEADVWSDYAINVRFVADDGDTYSFVPKDFPVRLPVGRYQVYADDVFMMSLQADGLRDLRVTPPSGPWLAWRDDAGQFVRGPTFALRSPSVLTRLLDGVRPLRSGEWLGYTEEPVSRPGLTAEQIQPLLAEARTGYIAAHKSMNALLEANDGPKASAHTGIMTRYLDVIVEFGDASDAETLISSLPPDKISPYVYQALVRLERRLGTLDDGHAVSELTRLMEEDRTSSLTPQLAAALARAGHGKGFEALAALQAEGAESEANFMLTRQDLTTLALEPTGRHADLFRAYLSRLKELSRARIEGVEVPFESYSSNRIWWDAAFGVAYLAKHGDASDRALLDIPLSASADFDVLLPFVTNPARLVDAYLGKDTPVVDWRFNNWADKSGNHICSALVLRSSEDAEDILWGIRQAWRRIVIENWIDDYASQSPEARQAYERHMRVAADLGSGHCRMTSTVVGQSGTNGAGEEDRKFDRYGLNPRWWVRPAKAIKQLETYASGRDYASLRGLSQYDTDWLREQIPAENAGDPDLIDVFFKHHGVITSAFHDPKDFFTFGSERRVFRLRNDGGNGSVSIGGHLDILPVPGLRSLTIAIHHEILSPDFGGLAAMITQPDRAPFEADDRIRMFDRVVLDNGKGETPARLVTTTPQGVHIFSVPWNGTTANQRLRIGMKFWNVSWHIDVPLYLSFLDFAERRERTKEVSE